MRNCCSVRAVVWRCKCSVCTEHLFFVTWFIYNDSSNWTMGMCCNMDESDAWLKWPTLLLAMDVAVKHHNRHYCDCLSVKTCCSPKKPIIHLGKHVSLTEEETELLVWRWKLFNLHKKSNFVLYVSCIYVLFQQKLLTVCRSVMSFYVEMYNLLLTITRENHQRLLHYLCEHIMF